MSWPKIARLAAVLALAGLTAGCFQPLYGDHSVGGPQITGKLAAVEVAPIDAPNGSRIARVGVEVRDQLIYGLTGGADAPSPAYRLTVTLAPTQQQVIVDITSARPEIQQYGIDASYNLIDIGTGKSVISGRTFSRVSFNIPGQQQRFAGARGQRDAEDRAAKVIAESIRSRLASFFVTGS
jgi:LPS-assembly lipoprotein